MQRAPARFSWMQVRLHVNQTGGWASGRGAAVGLISSRIIWDEDHLIGTVMLQELNGISTVHGLLLYEFLCTRSASPVTV